MLTSFYRNLCVLLFLSSGIILADDFRVRPYIQNPVSDGMTIRWLSDQNQPEPGGPHPAVPWIHSVRVNQLNSGTKYDYRVQQGSSEFAASFRTPATTNQPLRFMVYSDSETEPESSTTPPVEWPASPKSNRPAGITKYVVDQTVGYRENLKIMASRDPDFILLTGDIVETGGEQRDWDEFWRHNAGDYGQIASSVPILPALGNHENYAGPGGGYSAEGANFATDKFLTYFEVPTNDATVPKHRGRYYRVNYGPLTIITLDSSDGLPHKSGADTNHFLEGSHAPDFNPGSEQFKWLEKQLADAQKKSRFTFVQFHHTMYGSGPHSVPAGREGFSGQSGIAMRVIAPILYRYGVNVVFSGHDEMLERSLGTGTEILPDGTMRSHSIHFYDVGIGGDGLRGPVTGFDNPYRKFLAHDDSPEIWNEGELVSGGKHYGHIEVNVSPGTDGTWHAELTPVHAFPRLDKNGKLVGWERRTYNDVVKISSTH